jgi:hypothetical protein
MAFRVSDDWWRDRWVARVRARLDARRVAQPVSEDTPPYKPIERTPAPSGTVRCPWCDRLIRLDVSAAATQYPPLTKPPPAGAPSTS